MSSKHNLASRLLAVLALATLSLATVAQAQPYGPGRGGPGYMMGPGMMDRQLFGRTKALPSWDSKTRWNNLLGGLAVRRMAGPSDQTNSPHPSSREGHHSTAGWSSSVLLSQLILNISHCVYRISDSAWTRRTDGIHDRCFNKLPRGD